jgi:hypothetical protein
VDRVHGHCGPMARLSPRWTASGVDNGCGGASPAHGP